MLDKIEDYSPYFKDILANAGILFMAVTAIGLASNALLMIAGWIVTLPAFAYGLSNISDQFLWFLWASVSMSACLAAVFPLAGYSGEQAAQYRIGYGLTRRVNQIAMLLSVILGLGLHGVLCVLLSWSSPADCFIAGPVQYIARFIGRSERSLFILDSFDFPREYTYTAIAIYLVLMAISCCAGYIRGHKKRVRITEWRESESEK